MAERGTSGVPAALVGVLALALTAGACATSDKLTGTTNNNPPPSNATACVSGTVQLSSAQAAKVDCSAGTTVTLAGGGASYLVVPNLAAGNVPNTAVQYVIGSTGVSATASVASASLASTATAFGAAAGRVPAPGVLQRSFDGALLRLSARNVASGRWRPAAGAASARASVAAAPPPVGSLRGFHVISTLDTLTTKFKPVTARLLFSGANILLYVDTLAPASGFTSAQIATLGQTFDQVLYPIDVAAFGPPSDIDQNGRLIMLLTPVVNALTPSAQCTTQGYVAGFFTGGDLVNRDTTSNGGEVFYALAPDPAGVFSCAHSVQNLGDQLGATFLHELQHLINFSQHVLVRNGNEEEGWLDEGLSLVAQELGAVYYENKYPAPSGRTSPQQLFPDSAEGYISDDLVTSYTYLLRPDTAALTLHEDDQLGLAWRGGDWLLLRWLGDQKGQSTFYKALDQSALTGIANIENAAGASFPSLFGDFSLALYTDSLPGLARGTAPAPDRFSTRNLRQMYAALFRVAGPSTDVPFAYPVQPQALPATGTVSASMVPGTMAFYRLNSASSASTVTITFSTPGGAPLAASLHPQLSIFRLPAGS